MNPLIEDIRTETPQTLIISGQIGKINTIPIRNMGDKELMALSQNTLFLTLEEMHTIQNYFQKIGRDPYDAELETLAQTWSEHCGHKTFKANLIIDGQEVVPLYRRLKDATKAINHPRVISCFKDNSGVFKINDQYGVCMKVETHNSPSALDPYGGAMTGTGGVLRDIVGTGKGAKVIASTDIFCLGPPDLAEEKVPEGCKHPRFILKGVIRGVADYGNQMGVPTVNGSLHFHEDFRAKPTVIVGAYGLISIDKAQKGEPESGDLVLSVGGKTGRDGVHGATFSSAEMTAETEKVNASAVQIGDPIEEKRAFDAILEMSAQNIIKAITDCGAGGFSSAVGEMGSKTGVSIDLEKAPLKYLSLDPWEIWISESQERMIIALSPENLGKAQAIFSKYNVEGTVIGTFTDDQQLRVRYNGETLCDLPMDFVHGGLAQLSLEGKTEKFKFEEPSASVLQKNNYNEALKTIMGNYNVCSKELIVRKYDHNVQGTAVQMPFAGGNHQSPNNASVLEPLPGMKQGVVIGHGLNPILNRLDPFLGSKWAILEAVANIVAQGADPENIALLDNFIYPKPDSKYLADLSRAIDACVETSKELGMPFISGKDSLSSTYRRGDKVIHIPPVLCVSAVGIIEDIEKTISSPFKKSGNKIVLIGETKPELGGSIYYDSLGYVGTQVPTIDTKLAFQIFKAIHQGIKQGIILSCQDISEGGLISSIAEMSFGELFGTKIVASVEGMKDYEWLFSESPGRFVCEVAEKDMGILKTICDSIPCILVGEINLEQRIVVELNQKSVLELNINDLKQEWQAPMKKVFG